MAITSDGKGSVMAAFFKRDKDKDEAPSVERELKRDQMLVLRDLIIGFLVILFFLFARKAFGFVGMTISPVLEDTRFGVMALDGETHYFDFAEAESIELRRDLKTFDKGEKLSGVENRTCCSGVYRNSEFGEYQLHVIKRWDCFIVVRTAEGVLAFNIESDETTEQLYEYLAEQHAALSQ